MITHSEECKRQWNPHVDQLAPWFVQAWHDTCTDLCFSENGRNKAGFNINPMVFAADSVPFLDRMVEALRTPIPTSIFTAKEAPMPERHEVQVTNTVIHVVHLNNEVVLDKEDRTTRSLFFPDEESANDFVSRLAEPVMPEPEPTSGGLCPSSCDFGDGVVHRCDRTRAHAGQHEDQQATGGYWSWP